MVRLIVALRARLEGFMCLISPLATTVVGWQLPAACRKLVMQQGRIAAWLRRAGDAAS